MRRRSWLLDGVLAAAILVIAIALVTVAVPPHGDLRSAAMIGTGVLAAAGVLFRRRFPLWLLGAATLDGVAGGEVSAALPLAAYAVTRYGPAGRTRWIALAVAGLIGLAPWGFTSGTETLNHVLIVLVLLVLPAVLGLWVRTRADLLVALRGRAERAEAEQQLRAREAVLAERARITREMHDVVGHRVSLMVLQAGAMDMAAEDPDRVRQLAGQLQDAGRRSLEELRQLLGLLQEDPDDDAPLAPQPTLDDVDELVGDSRRAGVDVTLTRCGTPWELDPTVGRTAYRVVQEALTNAGKHAPGGPVAVTLDLRDGELTVTVVNRRATRPSPALPSGGLGLIGLRERVRTVGGTLRAEPRLDGGFRLEAVMRVSRRASEHRRAARGGMPGPPPEQRSESGGEHMDTA
jgi:signal transduction histidine kinase